uniref:Uncharacterized protein n=1 Tax=viral metagenome TaxID=1070528 RepID=A0A6M3IS15_9ZZZZ
MAFFDDWDWGKLASGIGKTIVPAVTGYYGAKNVADANRQAAEIAQANAAANRGVITAANDRAIGFLQPQTDAAAPAQDYLRTVMAQNPNQLTPQQQIDLTDRGRAVVTNTPSGLRGSGRYLTASINDVQNRGKAGMIDANTRRSDTAASTLAARGAGASTGAANLSANAGSQITGVNTLGADAGANALTSTAASNAQTLGDLGSYFAQAMKDADRGSRYNDFKAGVA